MKLEDNQSFFINIRWSTCCRAFTINKSIFRRWYKSSIAIRRSIIQRSVSVYLYALKQPGQYRSSITSVSGICARRPFLPTDVAAFTRTRRFPPTLPPPRPYIYYSTRVTLWYDVEPKPVLVARPSELPYCCCSLVLGSSIIRRLHVQQQ